MTRPRVGGGRGFQTTGVREGTARTGFGEHSDALFMTSSFVFDSAQQAARRFDNEEAGHVYSRFSNPTVDAFQARLAALEGAEACLGTASGMSAILTCLMGVCSAGDRVVCSSQVFGATVALLDKFLSRFGVAVDYVHSNSLDDWGAALREPAALALVETPSNPLTRVFDLRALSGMCAQAGALLAADNCFCTPRFQRPLSLGADIVIHSGTKYIDGQGRALGGAVLASRELIDRMFPFMRAGGPALSPFNAWVLHKSLETLGVRMEAHQRSALEVARFLESSPRVGRVYHTGLPSHPDHALAARQQSGHSGIVSLSLKDGGREAAWEVINRTRLFSITANFGDARSTITHPCSTTHLRVPAEMRRAIGLGEELIRLSVGLEDAADIVGDIGQALEG